MLFTMRLLLVEDDRMIGDALRRALMHEGHAVDWTYDARAAKQVAHVLEGEESGTMLRVAVQGGGCSGFH